MVRVTTAHRILAARLYRLGRLAVLGFAALYAVMVTIHATTYTGVGLGTLAFAARTLKADAYDVASVISAKLLGYSIGIGSRPTRFALICQEIGRTDPAEIAKWDLWLKRMILTHSGAVWNTMIKQMDDGYRHPVLILQPGNLNVATVCPAYNYYEQNCKCDPHFQAFERGYFPVSDLTSDGLRVDEIKP
jgi:hypothetical protein